MRILEKEIDEIINYFFKKFGVYGIEKDYITNLVFSLINKKTNSDGIIINTSDYTHDISPRLYIFPKIYNYLYYKIVRQAIDDVDVLLLLIDDKKHIVELILKKLNSDPFKAEDYIIDSLEYYDGKILYSVFLARYIMSRIKGISTKTLEIPIVEIESQDVTSIEEVVVFDDKEIKASMLKVDDVSEDSFYDRCVRKCATIKGTICKDKFIDLVIKSGMFYDIDSYKEKFGVYFMMRFGYMNETFYSREEISSVTGIDLISILDFEMKVIERLRSYINNLFDGYETCLLKKSIIC